MSCQGCEAQVAGENLRRATALQKAIEYAKQKNTPVVLYKDEQGQFQHAELSIAQQLGYPSLQIVSPNVPTSTGQAH